MLGFCAQSVVRDTKDGSRFYIKTEKGILVTRDWRRFCNLGLGGKKTDGKITCDVQGRVLVCCGRTGDNRGLWRYDPSVPERGWKRLTDTPLAHTYAADPADARRIVICTYDAPYHDFAGGYGVSVSSDDGTTWKKADVGLPIRRATCVAFDPFDSEALVVGTSGGGFFRTRWPR